MGSAIYTDNNHALPSCLNHVTLIGYLSGFQIVILEWTRLRSTVSAQLYGKQAPLSCTSGGGRGMRRSTGPVTNRERRAPRRLGAGRCFYWSTSLTLTFVENNEETVHLIPRDSPWSPAK